MPLGTEGWVAVGLEAAAAALAILGALRLSHLNRLAGDRRMRLLAAFFVLAAAAFLLRLAETLALELRGVEGLRDGFEALDVIYWLRHAAMVAAIVAAALASRPRPAAPSPAHRAPVLAPVLLSAEPALALVEGLGFLWLSVRAGLNHVQRTSVGSLEVALGFALLTFARVLGLALSPEGAAPLGAPDAATAALEAAGLAVLLLALPRKGA